MKHPRYFSRHLTFLPFVVMILVAACAKISAPEGGPKDVTPPVVKAELPASKSKNFKTGVFKVKFDEFVQLDNVSQNLLVSPPMGEKPTVTLSGKWMKVKFDPSLLKDSTTYSFYFGKAIKDLHEGNYIDAYRYVLSTGPEVDSMQVSGEVRDAETQKPMEDTYVLLYDDTRDSAPRKDLPFYLTRTDKSGKFLITNIKHKTYKIYALKDANNNMKFDQPKEKFAFLDTTISPEMIVKQRIDTLKIPLADTLAKKQPGKGAMPAKNVKPQAPPPPRGEPGTADTAKMKPQVPTRDSIVSRLDTSFTTDSIVLFAFEENKTKQYLASNTRERKEKLVFVFNIPLVKDSVALQVINATAKPSDIMRELSPKHDTLIAWIVDTSLRRNDTLRFSLQYFRNDSLDQLTWLPDTVKPRYDARKDNQRGKLRCKLTSSVKNNASLSFSDGLAFEVNTPVDSFDITKVLVSEVYDTMSLRKTNDEFYALDSAAREIVDSFRLRPIAVKPGADDAALGVKDVRFGRNKFMVRYTRPGFKGRVRFTANGRPGEEWMIREDDEVQQASFCWITGEEFSTLKHVDIFIEIDGKVVDTVEYKPKKKAKNIVLPVLSLAVPQYQQDALFLDEKIALLAGNPIDSFKLDSIKLFAPRNPRDTSKLLESLPVTVERDKRFPRTIFISARLEKGKQYTLKIGNSSVTDIYGYANEEADIKIKTQTFKSNAILTPVAQFSMKRDSLRGRTFMLTSAWDANKKYEVMIMPGAFVDIYAQANDTAKLRFSVQGEEELGTLSVMFPGQPVPGKLVQLWDNDEKSIVRALPLGRDSMAVFKFLVPGDYKLKLVIDGNGNKKWDTGDYLTHLQAEAVRYFPGAITIKANWNNRQDWDLSKKETLRAAEAQDNGKPDQGAKPDQKPDK